MSSPPCPVKCTVSLRKDVSMTSSCRERMAVVDGGSSAQDCPQVATGILLYPQRFRAVGSRRKLSVGRSNVIGMFKDGSAATKLAWVLDQAPSAATHAVL